MLYLGALHPKTVHFYHIWQVDVFIRKKGTHTSKGTYFAEQVGCVETESPSILSQNTELRFQIQRGLKETLSFKILFLVLFLAFRPGRILKDSVV